MEEMNEEEAISGDDDPIEGSSVPSEPQIKSKSKKQK